MDTTAHSNLTRGQGGALTRNVGRPILTAAAFFRRLGRRRRNPLETTVFQQLGGVRLFIESFFQTSALVQVVRFHVHAQRTFIFQAPSTTYADPAIPAPKPLATLGPEIKMSLTKQMLNEIRRANAQKSTGPQSAPGKQRSSMNA